jgi:hypothetical protein
MRFCFRYPFFTSGQHDASSDWNASWPGGEQLVVVQHPLDSEAS